MADCYINDRGRKVFVYPGLGHAGFMTMWGSSYGGHHRVVTKYLPVRDTAEQAQADLDAYAARKGWKRVER